MRSTDTIAVTLTTLLIWGFAGALFGALFTGLHQVLGLIGLSGWQPLVLGAAAAAMTTSAFYSAMPMALLGTMAGILASIGYLMVTGQNVDLMPISTTAGGGGLLAGFLYVWAAAGSGRPLVETLIGLIAGLVAGILLALPLTLLDTELGPAVLAAGVVALVGTFFQVSERWLVPQAGRWLPIPDVLSVPLVAGLVAAVVGASVWIMVGTTSLMLTHQSQAAADEVMNAIPYGLIGGLLGGAITGLLLQTFGFRPEQPR